MNKVLITSLVLLASPFLQTAQADGVFIPKHRMDSQTYSHNITEPSQKALIFYNEGIEQMTLQVSYRGKVSQFAWLVPTPSRPTVEKLWRPVFHILNQVTAPDFKYWLNADNRIINRYRGIRGFPHGARLDVSVLEEKQVGVYDIAVLKAGNASDLLMWLKDNGYSIPDGLSDILADYIHRGWVFTAMRVNVGMQAKSASKLRNGILESLLFTFKSDNPVYPLKISSMNKGKTDLLLYVVNKHRVVSPLLKTYSAISARVLADSHGFAELDLANRHFASSMVLTQLSGVLRPSQMTQDLIFERAKSDAEIRPTPFSPPFLANIGAVTVMFLGYSYPLLPSALCILMFVWAMALVHLVRVNWDWSFYAGVALLGVVVFIMDIEDPLRAEVTSYLSQEDYFQFMGIIVVLAVLTPLALAVRRKIIARK